MKLSELKEAIQKGFNILTTGAAENAKNEFIDELLKDEDYKAILFAMTGVAAGELSDSLSKLGIDFDKSTDIEKRNLVENLAKEHANKKNLKTALDLVWLGLSIGMAVKTESIGNISQVHSMISEIMRETDHGVGTCFLCNKRKYLKKWGPNEEPICSVCAEQHQEGVLDIINKKLRKKFGPNAPQAVAAGVVSKDKEEDSVESQIREAMRNMKEKDISKFN